MAFRHKSLGHRPSMLPNSLNIKSTKLYPSSEFQYAARRVPNHSCNLPLDDIITVNFIKNGICVPFRRYFRSLFMVDASNPASKTLLKSTAKIQHEEIRHLRAHYYMVHPFSMARFLWETFMILVYALMFLIEPVAVAVPATGVFSTYVQFLLDVVAFLDILMWFLSGYYDERKQYIVMRPSDVAKHYLKGYFVFDLIPALPINMVLWVFDDKAYAPWKMVKLLRIVRMPTLNRYIQRFGERMRWWDDKVRIIPFAITLITILMWTMCVTIYFYYSEGSSAPVNLNRWFLTILHALYRVVRCIFLVGMTDPILEKEQYDTICRIIFLLVGSLINVFVLAKIMQVYYRHAGSRNKYDLLIQQIDEYMRYKELPANVKAKVVKYVNFKYQKRIFKEAEILNTLSATLKQELLLHNCQRMVEKVEFFKDLPTPAMLRLVAKLRSEIFLASDVICNAGIVGHAMYFIYIGTVAVYAKNGKEICHLEDGSHFGEITLVINEPRVATVVAVTDCEVFRLSRRDFHEAIQPFPELCDKIRALALQRMEQIVKMMEKENEAEQRRRKLSVPSLETVRFKVPEYK